MKRKTLMIMALGVAFLFMIAGASMAGKNCSSGAKASCPSKANATTTADATAKNVAEGETIVLSVSNMTCGSCVNHVTKTLASVDGVNDVTVSLENGTAKVVYDESKVKPDVLASAVVKAGYPAKMAETATASAKKAGCDPAACAKMGCNPAACGLKTTAKDTKSADENN